MWKWCTEVFSSAPIKLVIENKNTKRTTFENVEHSSGRAPLCCSVWSPVCELFSQYPRITKGKEFSMNQTPSWHQHSLEPSCQDLHWCSLSMWSIRIQLVVEFWSMNPLLRPLHPQQVAVKQHTVFMLSQLY